MTYYDMYKQVNQEYKSALDYFNNCDMEHMDSAILNYNGAVSRYEAMLLALRIEYKISKEAENELIKFEQEEEERETIVDLVKKVLIRKGVKNGLV